ncbi:short-chain dehydrogenase TIC 32 B, chloroplastic-like [Dioscorea cayenensis subsp. rotundata]|uniref:Short-chain dehydrogenase TIC 32 B, chloroplastic-like n=1 Tax=Dioscorea cayennensis subsp. rotundata TaxID=55577 RepID=A0AB40B5X0_DIOCR|nr:short-chain dehydrogenase TIC 32 B, chloroplastic-like [Dioscorea cayenensis subsp. rotundata]
MLETVRYLIGSAGPSGFGSKSTAEDVTEATPDLGSITAIITGTTSGIGAETARVLAKRGARLVLPARSLKAAEETRARITAEFPGAKIIVLPLDLSSLTSVRSFVSRFLSLNLPLNLLINNAGKFSYKRAISEDGIEVTFATNHLGHFLLTKLLLNKMMETATETAIQGRIVNVSSSIHSWFSGDIIHSLDLLTRNKMPYSATRAYALSKLANVLHTKELALRLKEMGANVTVNCLHPGIVRTRLTRDREGFLTDMVFFLVAKLLKTIPQAAATTCYVAVHPRVAGVTGKYFEDCNEMVASKGGCSEVEAARLWRLSEEMISYKERKEDGEKSWFGHLIIY